MAISGVEIRGARTLRFGIRVHASRALQGIKQGDCSFGSSNRFCSPVPASPCVCPRNDRHFYNEQRQRSADSFCCRPLYKSMLLPLPYTSATVIASNWVDG